MACSASSFLREATFLRVNQYINAPTIAAIPATPPTMPPTIGGTMLFSLVALETAVPKPVAEEVAVDDQENILLDVGGLEDDGKGDGPLLSVSEKKTSVDC